MLSSNTNQSIDIIKAFLKNSYQIDITKLNDQKIIKRTKQTFIKIFNITSDDFEK
jgi:hypothetical protein